MILANARLDGTTLDVRIDGGLIVETAPSLGGGERVDLEGRWLVPGLWDEHVHFTQHTLNSHRVDLAPAASAAHAAELVRSAIESGLGASGVIAGAGFRDAQWPDAPGLDILDAATGAVQTVLISADLHSVWLNSAALAAHGRVGHPTGLLREQDAFDVAQRSGPVDTATIDGWARETARAAAARGVVGIVDLEMAWNLEEWQRRIAAGHDLLRIEFAIYPHHLDRAIADGLHTDQQIGELLSVGRLKILADGSLNTRTAHTHDPYPDGTFGQSTVDTDELLAMMAAAKDADIECSLHAIGDRANTRCLDAFEATGQRGRIEHAQLLRDEDVDRFASLAVTASVQPEQAMDDRDVADRLWSGRTARSYPLRSLLDSGATLRFGSDAPVSPLDPWLGIAAAVTRSRDGREPWHAEQSIPFTAALAASTRTVVAEGEVADLVIVDRDPFTASGDELRGMPVAATLLGGRFTHRTF